MEALLGAEGLYRRQRGGDSRLFFNTVRAASTVRQDCLKAVRSCLFSYGG